MASSAGQENMPPSAVPNSQPTTAVVNSSWGEGGAPGSSLVPGKFRAAQQPASKFARSYLICYNVFAGLVWFNVVLKSIPYGYSVLVAREQLGLQQWFDAVFPSVRLGQLLSLLEIVHAATRLVKSDPITTATQVFSRLHVILIVWPLVVETQTAIGTTLTVVAWTLAELIRYPYYLAQLMDFSPYWLKWIRYSGFLVLYPLGVMGEVLTCYLAVTRFRSSPNIEKWTVRMPNRLNFAFDLKFVYQIILAIYPPGWVHMYSHMLRQRRRALTAHEELKSD